MHNGYDDMEEQLAADYGGEPEFEPKPAFAIDSAERLDWFMRKLAQIRGERELVKSRAALMIARLDADETSLLSRFEQDAAAYAKSNLPNGKRSFDTLHGRVQFRATPPRLKLIDANAALEWATLEMPELAPSTPHLDTSAYRTAAQRRLDACGEILPGMEVAPAGESVTFQTDTKEAAHG